MLDREPKRVWRLSSPGQKPAYPDRPDNSRSVAITLNLQGMRPMKIYKKKEPFEFDRQDAIVAAIAVMLVVIWLFVEHG